MSELYFCSEPVRLALTLCAAAAALCQCAVIVLRMFRFAPAAEKTADVTCESALLLWIALHSLIVASVWQNSSEEMLYTDLYRIPRIVVFAVLSTACAARFVQDRKPFSLTAAAAAAAGLPFADGLGRVYLLIFFASLIFWILRSVYVAQRTASELREGLSSISVKQAIDALHTGILFCYPDGYIILSNRRMQKLMKEIAGRLYRSGVEFFGEVKKCCGKEDDEQPVYISADKRCWMFSKKPFSAGRHRYLQITASDVTCQAEAAEKLEITRKELEERSALLRDRLDHMMEYCRGEAAAEARSHVHDLLGAHLTVLLRSLRQRMVWDASPEEIDALAASCDGLASQMRTERQYDCAADEFRLMQKTFAAAGIAVDLDGGLPADGEEAQTVFEIAREAVNNAVRHALATEIRISGHSGEEGYRLVITDNGSAKKAAFCEGVGISGMRRRVNGLGGRFEVKTSPIFTIEALIPESVKT